MRIVTSEAESTDERRQGVVFAASAFLASRLLVVGAVIFGSRVAGPPGIWSRFQVFDAGWYLKAAQFGYPHSLPVGEGPGSQSAIAFFPAFPLAVRFVAAVTPLGFQAAGVFVSVLSGLVATILLWLYARRVAGREAADRTVVLFCIFPSTLALLLPFSEGIMLASTVGSFLAVADRKWLLAGGLAAVATASRPTAIAIVPALAWAALVDVRAHREWRALVAPLVAPAGFVAYFLFLWHHTGSPTAWFRVQTLGWGHGEGGILGVQAYERMTVIFRDPLLDMNSVAAAAAVVFAIAGLVLLLWWRPPGHLVVFAVVAVWFAMTTGIASRPRYMLVVFPIFIAMGVRLSSRRVYPLVVAASAVIMAMFIVITTATDLAVF